MHKGIAGFQQTLKVRELEFGQGTSGKTYKIGQKSSQRIIVRTVYTCFTDGSLYEIKIVIEHVLNAIPHFSVTLDNLLNSFITSI